MATSATKTTSATNMAYWSAGASVLQSLIGFATTDTSAIERQGDMAVKNINAMKENYLTRLQASHEQQQAVDRELGTVLSRRGLEAMKAEARLRAASASTGLSGGTIDEVLNQTKYDEILDAKIAISRARKTKADIERQKVVDFINLKNSASSVASSMPTMDTNIFGSIASWLGEGLGVYNTYLKYGGKDFIGDKVSSLFNTPETRLNLSSTQTTSIFGNINPYTMQSVRR